MKLTVDEDGDIKIESLFEWLVLEASPPERLIIKMAGRGFEFFYGGKWFSAEDGKIKKLA
jgi:hypothetical protein